MPEIEPASYCVSGFEGQPAASRQTVCLEPMVICPRLPDEVVACLRELVPFVPVLKAKQRQEQP